MVATIRPQPRSTSRPRPIITTIHITTTRKIIEEKSWSKGTFKQSCSVKKTTSIPPINFYFSQNNRIYGPDSQQIHSGKITNLFVRNFGISKRSTCQENKSCPSPIPKHFTTTPGYRRGDSVFLQLENRSSWHTNFLRNVGNLAYYWLKSQVFLIPQLIESSWYQILYATYLKGIVAF